MSQHRAYITSTNNTGNICTGRVPGVHRYQYLVPVSPYQWLIVTRHTYANYRLYRSSKRIERYIPAWPAIMSRYSSFFTGHQAKRCLRKGWYYYYWRSRAGAAGIDCVWYQCKRHMFWLWLWLLQQRLVRSDARLSLLQLISGKFLMFKNWDFGRLIPLLIDPYMLDGI